jgi:[histone H3]-dimethyl-L-lysine9 demethylase
VYAALKTVWDDFHHGSTRLHMDMSDAVNLMTFCSPPTGYARWDIFASEDTEKLRLSFTCRFGTSNLDPIHSQVHYLGPSELKLLWERFQVKPFVIFQYIGQAVFIPAGCAHQVCGLL